MALSRATRCARALFLGVSVFAFAAVSTGCDLLSSFSSDEPQEVNEEDVVNVVFGGCLRAFGRDVFDVAATGDGSTVLYISAQRPPNLADEAVWRRDDRALYIRQLSEGGAPRLNFLARTWEVEDTESQVPAYSTPRPGQSSVDGFRPTEMMEGVEISEDGRLVVIAVSRGNSSTLMRLYQGAVPDDVLNTKLSPNEDGGLAPIPVNNVHLSEPIQQWSLSPDGSRVAAEVGTLGELRVYDLAEGRPYVYGLDGANEIVVGDTLPAEAPDMDDEHRAGVLLRGGEMHWSPDSSRVAIARTVGVGSAIVQVLDVASGELKQLRRYDATVLTANDGRDYEVTWSTPQLSWSAAGDSLYMLQTPIGGPELFYNSQFREIDADSGQRLGDASEITRFANWRTEPANLINMGTDESFLFEWEDHLYRANVPGGSTNGLESPSQLTSFPEGVSVIYDTPPDYVLETDTAYFRVMDRGTLRVGERSHVSQSECPNDVQAAPEGDAR